MSVAEKLKALRNDKGLSRRDVVFDLEKNGFSVTEQTIANWEKGKSKPNIEDAMVLSKYYGIQLQELSS